MLVCWQRSQSHTQPPGAVKQQVSCALALTNLLFLPCHCAALLSPCLDCTPMHRSPRVSSSDWQCSALQMATAARRGQPSTSTAAGVSSNGAVLRAAEPRAAGSRSSRPGSSSCPGSTNSSNRSTAENCAVAAVPAGSTCQVLQIGTQSAGIVAFAPFSLQHQQQLVGAQWQTVLDVLPRSGVPGAAQQQGSGIMPSSTPPVYRQVQAAQQAPKAAATAAAAREASAQAAVASSSSTPGSAAERMPADAGSTGRAAAGGSDGTSGAPQASKQQQQPAVPTAAAGGSSPEEIVAGMVTSIASGLGSPVAGAAAEDPILLIGR